MAALQNAATVRLQHKRFLQRIIDQEAVYYLANEDGVANSISNDDDETVVLPFWSDRAYASRAAKTFDDEFTPTQIPLFDFLYRWLPGMSEDGVLAGTNWDGHLIGTEIDPFDLRTQIENQLPPKQSKAYESMYNEATSDA